MENVKRNKHYHQVVVWPATIIGKDEAEEFERWMKEEHGFRVQYLEEIETGPDMKNGEPVPDTGGRNDAFFGIHEDDIGEFAIWRIQYGMRWIEDIYYNNRGYLYPERVRGYCGWGPGVIN